MKLIIAIVRPEKFRDVRQAMLKADVGMMTVLDVRGCGQQKGYVEEYRGVIEEVTLHRKVAVLVAVNDSFVDKTIKTIVRSARTNTKGSIGDGKIFVLPLEECVRISGGEMGVAAIGGNSEEVRSLKKKTFISIK